MFKEKIMYRDERSIQWNSFWHRAYSQSFEKCRRYNERRKYRRGRKRIHQYYCYTTWYWCGWSTKKYGSIDGVYQEKEGPEVAKEILKKVGYNKNIDRICFIIGNHHTPSKIDGLDFQIQWEADLLENLTVMDKEKEQEKIKKCIDENFKTNTGKRIAYNRFILD